MNGYPAISASRAGSPGGVGYFGIKITGYQDQAITLVIRRMAGYSGSAIFTDTGMDVMTVWGDCDCYVKIRGQDFSTVARNMQLQAYPPVPFGGPPATTDFSVFWVVDSFSNFGAVPDDAWGAQGPIADLVPKFRQDRQNQLGVAIGEDQYKIRGHKLTTYPIFPYDLDPDDLRRGGPGNGFDILRKMTARYYLDGCLTPQNNVDDYKESSARVAKDVAADRPNGNAQLRLYDWDAPSVTYPWAGIRNRNVDHDVRGRANFVEWTTYVDDDGTENRTSADLSWYFRGAWHWDAQNFKLTMQGAPGDNEVAGGTTPLTFDLNPSTDPDITITGFDKVTAPNSIDFVDVHIFGNFPLAGTGCEYQAYLVAGTADSSGDPTDGLDGDFYAALGANRIDQNTLLARFPMKRQGEITTTPLPIPAKTYQIKVVQGTKYAQKGDFTVTENPFTQWKFVGFKSDGIHVTVVALSFDAAGNVVSRPGGARPSFQQIAGVQLSPFDNYGRYGEYWGRALVVNLGQSGQVTIQVSGGGGTPDTQVFIIP